MQNRKERAWQENMKENKTTEKASTWKIVAQNKR